MLCIPLESHCLAVAAFVIAMPSIATGAYADATPLSLDRASVSREHARSYIDTMQLTEASMRSNYDKITTWSGSYELSEGVAKGSLQLSSKNGLDKQPTDLVGDFWIQRKLIVRFELDIKADKLFSTFEITGPQKVLNRANNQPIQGQPISSSVQSVLTPEHWLKVQTNENLARGKGVNTGIRSASELAERFMEYSVLVDPRRFFAMNHKQKFFEFQRVCIDWLEMGKDVPFEIQETRNGNDVSYTFIHEFRFSSNKQESPRIVKLTYDSKVGFNPTSMTETDGKGHLDVERTWAYKFINGVFLPDRVSMKKYAETSNQVQLQREFRLIDTKLNEPIDEGRFSWNRLSLMQGDQIRDDIKNELYRFDQGKLVPDRDYVEVSLGGAGLTEKDRGWNYLFIIANIGVCVLLLAMITARRYWRTSH